MMEEKSGFKNISVYVLNINMKKLREKINQQKNKN